MTSEHGDRAEIPRPRVDELIGRAVAAHRVTVMCAPAGFGKTLALRSWRSEASQLVTWAHVDADSRPIQPLLPALPSTGEQGVVVIDDLNRPLDPAGFDPIRRLVVEGAPAVRVVLSGRSPFPLALARLGLSERVGFIGPDDLAFTVEEIVELAASTDRPLPVDAATATRNETSGWPAAVRLALDARRRAGAPPVEGIARPTVRAVSLTDYVVEEVLQPLPDDLAEFVLRATVCDEINGERAALLWGDASGAAKLRECIERGVFLDRRDGPRRTTVHRWNPVFAARCRAILADRHPDAVADLHRRAAEALRSTVPAQAADLALRGRDPELAASIISDHWIQMMLEHRAASLEASCRALPLPWSDRPETLLVRACCRRAAFDDPESARLRARAHERAGQLDEAIQSRFRVLSTYADLVLADDAVALADASDRAVATLADQRDERPALHASVLFLAGFAEMRLRRDRDRAVSSLREASLVCRANGSEALGHRATAYAAFVLAYWGDFEDALASIAPHTEVATLGEPAIDGAIGLTRGYVGYWRNQLDVADSALRSAIPGLDEPPADASNVHFYLALTAVARGGSADLVEAEQWLGKMAPDGTFGLPWGVYRGTVEALIAERRGDLSLAAELARSIPRLDRTPVSDAMLAALLRRTGDRDAAVQRLRHVGPTRVRYAQVHVAVVEALLAADVGDADAAHVALERALDLAEPERVVRSFSENLSDLRPLLDEHAAWGTRHEQFVVTLLDDGGAPAAAVPRGPLSRRELEILGYMRTRMTANDIASALFISVATVKTHQRSIYRKLGVANRRDALRAALAGGLT